MSTGKAFPQTILAPVQTDGRAGQSKPETRRCPAGSMSTREGRRLRLRNRGDDRVVLGDEHQDVDMALELYWL